MWIFLHRHSTTRLTSQSEEVLTSSLSHPQTSELFKTTSTNRQDMYYISLSLFLTQPHIHHHLRALPIATTAIQPSPPHMKGLPVPKTTPFQQTQTTPQSPPPSLKHRTLHTPPSRPPSTSSPSHSRTSSPPPPRRTPPTDPSNRTVHRWTSTVPSCSPSP